MDYNYLDQHFAGGKIIAFGSKDVAYFNVTTATEISSVPVRLEGLFLVRLNESDSEFEYFSMGNKDTEVRNYKKSIN